MPTTVSVIELTQDYLISYGDVGDTGTRSFIDASARPTLSAMYLPDIGDTFSGSVSGDYSNMICTSIQKVPWDGDPTVGYKYVCTYSQNAASYDPIGTKYEKVISISTDGGFDSYQFSTASTSSSGVSSLYTQIYAGPGGSGFEPLEQPTIISIPYTITRISVTNRYRGNLSTIITENTTYANKLNNTTWNGCARGTVLCTGVQASPVEEIKDGLKKQYWNRTISFSIKSLPASTVSGEDTWQMVFIEGKYCRLARGDSGSPVINLYDYATLPESSL